MSNTTGAIIQTARQLAAVGVDLPDTVRDLMDLALSIRDRGNVAPQDITYAAADITAKSAPAVIDTLVRERLEEGTRRMVAGQLADAVAARAGVELNRHRDSLILEARKGFDAAVHEITQVAHTYPPALSPGDVITRGTDAATAAATISNASATLDQYRALWPLVTGIVFGPDAVVESYDGDWWRRVDAGQILNGENSWHHLIAEGYRLKLNTVAEAQQLAATPEKHLRSEMTDLGGGVRGYSQVR